jgi:hypothetical protein
MNKGNGQERKWVMRAAWIGFGGAILGAVIAIVGPYHYQNWLKGPEEGLFALDVTSLRPSSIDSRIRDQVEYYPVFAKLWHRQGPTATGISATLTSPNQIHDLVIKKNTEDATVSISNDKHSVRIEAPELRKGGIVQFEFSVNGDPLISQAVQVNSGSLLDDTERAAGPPWYQSDAFLTTLVFLMMFGLLAVLTVLASRSPAIDIRDLLSQEPRIRGLVLFCLVTSVIPIVGDIVIVIPLLLIGGLLARVDAIEVNLHPEMPPQVIESEKQDAEIPEEGDS